MSQLEERNKVVLYRTMRFLLEEVYHEVASVKEVHLFEVGLVYLNRKTCHNQQSENLSIECF